MGGIINGFQDVSKDIQKLMPDYEYLIYDLSAYTDEEIKGRVQLRIAFTMFRDIFTKDDDDFIKSVLRSIRYLQDLENRETGIEYFETLIRYIFSVRPNLTKRGFNEVMERVEDTYPEGSEVVMTLRELFIEEGKQKGMKQGMQQGMKQGMQEGERKKSLHYAVKLLTKKFGKLPEGYKSKLRKADTETLDLIVEEIFALESLNDIDKYL